MKKRGIIGLAAVLVCMGVLLSPAYALTQAEGEHVQWIDRIYADPAWPQETHALYSWLAEQGALGADGALADPSKAQYFPEYGVCGYELAVLENETPVRFRPSSDKTNNQEAAWAAITDFMRGSGMEAMAQEIADYAISALNAYDRDHPEIFWLEGDSGVLMPVSYTYSSDGEANFTQRIILCLYGEEQGDDVRTPEYRDPAVLRRDIAALQEAVDAILAGVPDGSRYVQLAYLNSWLTKHNSYCYTTPTSRTRNPLTALTGSAGENGPVCESYARALKILCGALEIPCVLVSGTARHSADSTGEAHMWNYVQMEDGRWYAVDVTWNDPILTDDEGNRIDGAQSGYENEKYFLLCAESEVNGMRFADSHAVVNQVSLNGFAFVNEPPLSATEYLPYAVRMTVDGESRYYNTFADAAAAADGKSAVLTLLQNAGTGRIAPGTGSEWILDLNGYTLSGTVDTEAVLIRIGTGAKLTVRDSSFAGTGGIRSSGKLFSAAGGTIVLEP